MSRFSGRAVRLGALVSTIAVTATLLGACTTSKTPAEKPSSTAARTPATPPSNGVKPTVVLVHGAWADTSSWDGEVSALLKQGYDVRAIANPLENLTTDADYRARTSWRR